MTVMAICRHCSVAHATTPTITTVAVVHGAFLVVAVFEHVFDTIARPAFTPIPTHTPVLSTPQGIGRIAEIRAPTRASASASAAAGPIRQGVRRTVRGDHRQGGETHGSTHRTAVQRPTHTREGSGIHPHASVCYGEVDRAMLLLLLLLLVLLLLLWLLLLLLWLLWLFVVVVKE